MKYHRLGFCALFMLLLLPISLQASTPKKPIPDVDIVYTWVDSSDPLWQKERAQYENTPDHLSNDGNANCRFRSRDELKYSLRSLYKYAPYVRKIFIVTNGQKPAWIRPHPMISFITHQQIFRDSSHLPTFNSMAIESCLHRIPGLSEFYVYFNDDVFIGKATDFETFFTKKGKVRLFISDKMISKKPNDAPKFGYRSAIKNVDRLLDEIFVAEERPHLSHTPDPCRKSLVSSIEIQFHTLFAREETYRFRCAEDYAMTNGLIPYAAFYLGNGEKTYISSNPVILKGEPEKEKKEFDSLLKEKPLFFCLQDCQEQENPKTDQLLHQFLEKMYPNPAPWEQ